MNIGIIFVMDLMIEALDVATEHFKQFVLGFRGKIVFFSRSGASGANLSSQMAENL